jgi:uncharacterized phosphatase
VTLLYLIRHGETDWNRARRIQGSTDIPLNDLGRSQAAATGRLLARHAQDHAWHDVFSSPLSRAFETGEIIARELGIERVKAIPTIVERSYGQAEGLDDRELSRRFPGDTPVPGRETREEVAARVIPALIELAERHPGSNLIVTTHGGVIRTVLNFVAPDHKQHRGIPIANGSVHSFAHVDGSLELRRFNDPLDRESIDPEASAADDDQLVEL